MVERRQGNFAASIYVYERVHLSHALLSAEQNKAKARRRKKVTNGEISYALLVAHISTAR